MARQRTCLAGSWASRPDQMLGDCAALTPWVFHGLEFIPMLPSGAPSVSGSSRHKAVRTAHVLPWGRADCDCPAYLVYLLLWALVIAFSAPLMAL